MARLCFICLVARLAFTETILGRVNNSTLSEVKKKGRIKNTGIAEGAFMQETLMRCMLQTVRTLF